MTQPKAGTTAMLTDEEITDLEKVIQFAPNSKYDLLFRALAELRTHRATTGEGAVSDHHDACRQQMQVIVSETDNIAHLFKQEGVEGGNADVGESLTAIERAVKKLDDLLRGGKRVEGEAEIFDRTIGEQIERAFPTKEGALLPCRCGGLPQVKKLAHKYWNATVQCPKCFIRLDDYNLPTHLDGMIRDWNRHATDFWNTRQATPPAQAGTRGDNALVNGPHPDSRALVADFAHEMAIKLRYAERKYGYSNGWLTDDWQEKCGADLLKHLAKGDPRDVAIYAAFMWRRGWSTSAPPPPVSDDAAVREWEARELITAPLDDKLVSTILDWERRARRMAQRIRDLQGKVETPKRNRCEHCDAKVSSYPNGCPGCGAPQCCQSCCDRQNAITRAEAVEREIEAMREVCEQATLYIERGNRLEFAPRDPLKAAVEALDAARAAALIVAEIERLDRSPPPDREGK